jgi:hypothetical protein
MTGPSKILLTFINTIKAVYDGELLMRIHAHKYFLHIIYTFLLFWIAIWLGMKVDKSLVRVEDNKETLSDLKIYHAQKTVQIERLNSISKIEDLLQEQGSIIGIPENPATTIEKK